jgi:histone-lysine N-methyltransferase SETMAR
MATVFWDTGGVIHMDFLKPGTTISLEHYIAALKTLKQQLRRVQNHYKNILLQHDNSRPNTLQTIIEAIEKLDLILPYPPHSPDLAPYNFYLFPKIKKDLHGHLYNSNEEVERTVRTLMNKTVFSSFVIGFRNLSIIGGSVENGGGYVEKYMQVVNGLI